MDEIHKEQLRFVFDSYIKIKHRLRSAPNIVSCDCFPVSLDRFCVLPMFSSYPKYKYFRTFEDRLPSDEISRLVCAKTKFNSKLTVIQSAIKKEKKLKKVRKVYRSGFVSHNIMDLVNHLETDPDPHFSGGYNWYYTGGCLEVVFVNNTRYLLYSFDKKIVLSSIDSIDPNYSIEANFTVFEVNFHNNIVMARGRNCIEFYKIGQTKKIDSTFKINSDIPYISCTVLPNSIALTINADHKLELWKLNNKRAVQNKFLVIDYSEGKECKDNWCKIVHLKDNYVLLIFRKTILLIDINSMTVTDKKDLSDWILPACSEVSEALLSSLNSNIFYVATTHQIFALEFEVSEDDRLKLSVAIRWTHQLNCPVSYLKTHMCLNDKEVLFVGSQQARDCKILLCENERCQNTSFSDEEPENETKVLDIKPHSFHPAFKPFDMTNCLYKSVENGFLLNVDNSFKERIYSCNSGISISSKSDTIELFTINSYGDLSVQKLSEKPFSSEEMEQSFKALANQLMSQIKPHILKVTNIANLRKCLETVIEGNNTKNQNDLEFEQLKRRRRPKWDRPISKLKEYKDALAQDMLAVWEISDDEADNDQIESANVELQSTDKVQNWLSQSSAPIMEMEDYIDKSMFNYSSLSFGSQEVNTQFSSRSVKKKRILGF